MLLSKFEGQSFAPGHRDYHGRPALLIQSQLPLMKSKNCYTRLKKTMSQEREISLFVLQLGADAGKCDKNASLFTQLQY